MLRIPSTRTNLCTRSQPDPSIRHPTNHSKSLPKSSQAIRKQSPVCDKSYSYPRSEIGNKITSLEQSSVTEAIYILLNNHKAFKLNWYQITSLEQITVPEASCSLLKHHKPFKKLANNHKYWTFCALSDMHLKEIIWWHLFFKRKTEVAFWSYACAIRAVILVAWL